MVAYSFKARFVEPILTGAKTQTIRAFGKRRHARVGETLQLYTAMRTKQCRKITDKICAASGWVHLNFAKPQVMIDPDIAAAYYDLGAGAKALDAFAVLDGFGDWPDMREFWKAEHDALTEFRGMLIRWAP